MKLKKYPWIFAILITAICFWTITFFRHENVYTGGVITSGDLMTQYTSFFQYFRHVVFGNYSDFAYSFSNGLGGSMIGNWSYYLLSPLNFIVLLFPASKITLALYTIIWIKVMLAAGSFCYAIQKLTKLSATLAIMVSISYALSSYTIFYMGNLMWLDAIVFLPLLILLTQNFAIGIRKFIYPIILAITILANYYTSYMIGLFLVAYFLYNSFLTFKTWNVFFKNLAYFVLYSITGILLTLFIELPTLFNLKETKLSTHYAITNYSIPKLIFNIPSNIFFGANNTQLPLIYTSSLILLLTITYFFNTHIQLKSRIATLILLLFTCSGLLSNKLYVLWHAGQPPQSYPFRFAFIINFLVILIASYQLSNLEFTKKQILPSAIILTILLVISIYVRHKNGINSTWLISSACWALLAIIIYWFYTKNKINSIWLIIITILEISLNAIYSWHSIIPSNYTSYTVETQKLINQLPVSAKNSRLEKNFLIDQNRGESYTFNYRGATVFSSNNDIRISNLYDDLGLQGLGYFYFYLTGTQLTDALFGIKTNIQTNRPNDTIPKFRNYGLRDDLSHNPILYKDSHNIAYKSETFPLAFAGYNYNNFIASNNPLENQSKILNKLTNSNTQYFSKAIQGKVSSQNAKISNNKNTIGFDQIDDTKPIKLTFNYIATPNTSAYIILDKQIMTAEDGDSKASQLTVNGKSFRSMPFSTQPIGIFVPATGKVTLTMTFKTSTHNLTITQPSLYLLNKKALYKTIKKAQNNKMKLTSWKGNLISGTITIHKGQSLITTIPYTNGWHAKVDGTSVPINKTLDSFINLNLPSGKHTVTLYFEIPGLKLGIFLTIIGLLLLLLENIFINKKQ
ncbi:YfhO family protein [Lactobacillus mulieris]|uniref:YfhO family protein n=1 Tax=Lactobacillus mulieris TaxID=2508708 RepID=UPI0014330A71|nr:YfhO family protein [Lactobacillus mulieris]MDK6802972.1 YfhO family protein [Lactobacillus mulieris]MDK8382088.1 YfhO family protein [Lactobacillus mulieris]MDT9620304.1 YfhO family protein [Lactobacillus mulieris]NKC41196.1 YfhO family protein [Lactobacillus mulieris]